MTAASKASGAGDVEGQQPLTIFLVAGEHSGDALGAKLMEALRRKSETPLLFSGVGGEDMARQGLVSVFPIEDVAVMGPLSILPRLPRIVRRVYQTVDAALAIKPSIVVIIDSPEFTHPIAKRIRSRAPHIPIVDYVSPSVWAWRPGRAKRMRGYIDEVLALLPFEPDAHARLGGPPCTYVGHPLIERLDEIRNADASGLAQRLNLDPNTPVLLVLPGSRRSEVERLIGDFGDAVGALAARGLDFVVVIPAVKHVRDLIEKKSASWTIKPFIVDSASGKYAAMRLARAALAASGTVTLELGLAGVPAVVAYKVDALMLKLRFMLKVPSIVLTNLVAGRNIYPECLQDDCNGQSLAAAIAPLMRDSEARTKQINALAEIPGRMSLASGTPSEVAAAAILRVLKSAHSAGKSRRAGPT